MNARSLCCILITLTLAAAAQAGPIQVRWYGQSFFTLTSASNIVVAMDPFDGSFVNYPIPQDLKADVLLVTHEHRDHNNVAIIKGDPFVMKSERGIGKEEKHGIKLRGIGAYHDNEHGAQRGRNTIYTIEMDGVRLCHLGDIGQSSFTDEQLARIGAVDVLFLPAGGQFTTEPKDLRKLVDQIKPRVAVPMHYKSPYTRDLPLAPLDEFLTLNKDLPVKRLEAPTFAVTQEELPDKTAVWVPALP
jgi:L-ascorbate metabolism protein UlaG (beta-lactamase superfamily)